MFTPKITENKEKRILCYPQLCKSCGLCIEICPKKAISFDSETVGHTGNPAVKVDVEKCIGCKQCENICPDCAIKVFKVESHKVESL